MGFLDDMADVINDVTSEAKDKAIELKEIASLKREYRETEKRINYRYQELGKKYYEKNKNRAKNQLADITEALDKLDYLQEAIDKLQGNDVACDACGAKNSKDATYCSRCGVNLAEAKAKAEAEAAENVDAEVVEEETKETEE
ncbi:MAG: hypothetical protein K5644_00810 [Lachnospiraceae bacterium]|nr:hypothetical protein [Lachnospiraceae bacterium]